MLEMILIIYDQIIKGKDIKQEKFFSKSFASTSFLNG